MSTIASSRHTAALISTAVQVGIRSSIEHVQATTLGSQGKESDEHGCADHQSQIRALLNSASLGLLPLDIFRITLCTD